MAVGLMCVSFHSVTGGHVDRQVIGATYNGTRSLLARLHVQYLVGRSTRYEREDEEIGRTVDTTFHYG